jgi:hypothetical protein
MSKMSRYYSITIPRSNQIIQNDHGWIHVVGWQEDLDKLWHTCPKDVIGPTYVSYAKHGTFICLYIFWAGMHNTQFHGLCVVPHTPTHIHQKRNEFRNHKLPYYLGSFDTNYIFLELLNYFFQFKITKKLWRKILNLQQ